MTFGRASAGRLFVRPHRAGDRAVACAAAMPLVVLALALAVDYASVSQFRARVQLAADAASLAAAAAIAGQPGCADGSGGQWSCWRGRDVHFCSACSARRGRDSDTCGEEPPRCGYGHRRIRGRGA